MNKIEPLTKLKALLETEEITQTEYENIKAEMIKEKIIVDYATPLQLLIRITILLFIIGIIIFYLLKVSKTQTNYTGVVSVNEGGIQNLKGVNKARYI